MTFRGVLRGGKIELDSDVEFPEGTVFEVQPSPARKRRRTKGTVSKKGSNNADVFRLAERAVTDAQLPADLAAELDHYVYGAPKRSARRSAGSSRVKGSGRPQGGKSRKPAKRRGR